MNRKAHPIRCILITISILVVLGGCGSPEAAGNGTQESLPTRSETRTPIPDASANADAGDQTALSDNMTQNAEVFATDAGMMTATSRPGPATATPTKPASATPQPEGPAGVMVNGILVHYADIRTGLEDVDQIIDIVLAGDMTAFRRRVQFTVSGCTHEMALGGPPKCREGEAEGALVEVLPFLGPEGHFLRRDQVADWQGIAIAGLYAVYRVSDEAFSSEDYPAGEYGVAFRAKDGEDIVTFQVKNGLILRIDVLFSIPPELDFDRLAQEIILPPPAVDSGCPGAAPPRVTLGEMASVCTKADGLLVRYRPGIDGRVLIGVQTGTNFVIIDGPSCADDWFWWKIELDSGLEGWVAEGGDEVDPYFICPAR